MKVLFTICGRAGSKGVKNKNISLFCGKPLLLYSLSSIDLFIKRNQNIQYDIVISTDSEELISIYKNNIILDCSIIKRSKKLCGDTIPKKDVIRDCLIKMEKSKHTKYDVVVDLDITSPLRTVKDISNLLKTHINTNADLTYSVTPARRNPYFNQVVKGKYGYHKVITSNFTARQQAPSIYDMNASLYAYKPSYLLQNLNADLCNFQIIKMLDTGFLDIDNKNDYEMMQIVADYLFKSKKEYGEIFKNIN